MSTTRWTAALVGGAAAIGCCNAAAQGIDLRDKIIGIETTYTYEKRDLVRNTVKRDAPDQSERWITAVAGKLVWVGNSSACGLSLVYAPGRTVTAKADCAPKRTGTASNWIERSSAATYRTTTAVAGDVVTLKGEMKGTYAFRMNSCNQWEATTRTTFTVVQSLKMRITGDRCEILDFNVVELQDESGERRYADGHSVPSHEIKRTAHALAPSRTCTIQRRSEQPNGPPLADPDIRC